MVKSLELSHLLETKMTAHACTVSLKKKPSDYPVHPYLLGGMKETGSNVVKLRTNAIKQKNQ